MEKINEREDKINESIVKKSNLIKIDSLAKVINSICKIKYKINKNEIKCGTGFLIKLNKGNIQKYWLMTNEHVINSEMVKNKEKIEVFYKNDKKNIDITLNDQERIIRNYIHINIDVTIIEIHEEEIKEKYFLLPNEEYLDKHFQLNNEQIYILQFPNGEKLSYSYGKIKEIKQYEIIHLSSTQGGSSGSPIILKDSTSVLGIHKAGNKNGIENYGDMIYPIIESLKKDSIYKIIGYKDKDRIYEGDFVNGKCEGYGKYIFENYYYIGQWSNDNINGKGFIYNKNNKIVYEGEFVNNIMEGKGKIYLDNGDIYYGQWSNGLPNGEGVKYYNSYQKVKEYDGLWNNNLKHGKGKEYYENGNIKYDGDFFYGKYEGNGKYIYMDGSYYEGEWKNNKRNGKGTYFNKDKKRIYTGDFVNDKIEGNGEFFWPNGSYYIGQWSNNEPNGKGTIFYNDGTIKYEGDFINSKYDGYGKKNYKNGDFYIGDWKNNQKNGSGKVYNKNNVLKYEGIFINNKFIK